jgi:hypothetical protein
VDNARALPTCPPPQQQQKDFNALSVRGEDKTPH